MIEALYQRYLQNRTISTDTRTITKGCIFFALKGPNFDANKFAKQALDEGASFCVIDDNAFAIDERCIVVNDTLQTLQDLAKHHRAQLTIPVIGLTGSNGKTTTKELLVAALSPKYKVLATKGNLNNHIGVPLTLLSIIPEHELAVIEMGANHVGEIAMLCAIANPTHGLITNIGKAHLEGFGGIEGVIRGKSELYNHLIKNNGTVWINSNSEILSNMAKRFLNPLFYPNKGNYYHCEFVKAAPEIVFTAENNEEVKTHLIGAYNFENIAAALSVAKYFEVSPKAANQGIANYLPENNRSQVIKRGSNTIILDAYNANPTSMLSALDNMAKIDAVNKVVILGDMKELGEHSANEHENLGNIISEMSLNQVYLCGPLIKPALKQVPKAHYFEDRSDLINEIRNHPIQNSTILIKASRGIGLEMLLEVL
ncbi:MAG TPA: UDP-N-acetylmuramoyl-tripeptide--D-alanyl-D-alanine ligase [Fulvivirga sp.]|nr:UDP-N-acetylmuramoyl-tripeptide--D-alanyl-D-alanine ligase [Fulvivirga sp.]